MKIFREAVHHPDESLRLLHLELPTFEGGLHRHAHAELTWIERGQGLRWVSDSVEPFIDGDLVLVGGEVAHLWASRGPQPAAGCAATVLQFKPDWAARTGLPELAGVSPLLLRAAMGLEIRGDTRLEVQRLLLRLRQATAARRVAAMVDLLATLMEGAADLRELSTRIAGGAPAADGLAGGQRVDRVLNWIEEHLAEELRVEDAAAVAHVSAAAFGRFFRREVGKSFTEYVNDARCGWAALQLIQGREPIAHIAQSSGFPTLSHFGEQFRRRYRLAPRAFRADARALRSD
ncbi:MAG: AraC family transcriptional regulator [Betaproteobacteria bacterium]|jgi:AraC-like DNA-binding protein